VTTVLIVVVALASYTMIGGATAGLAWKHCTAKDEGDETASFLCGLFWPIVILIAIGHLIATGPYSWVLADRPKRAELPAARTVRK
jgi:hypothetical protein